MVTALVDPNEQLRGEYSRLRDEYVQLFEEREHKVHFVSAQLTAVYVEQIGKYQYEVFALQTEVKAAKLKMEMIQAARNRDEEVSEKAIDSAIGEKLKDYYRIIAEQAQDAQAAKELLAAPALDPEQTKELKAIHSFFVKRLHPDINPNHTEADMELFLKIQTAYKNLDIMYLRDALLAYNDGNMNVKENSLSLQDKITQLKNSIGQLKGKLKALSETFPFVYEDRLFDGEWIASEQAVANEKITQLKEELSIYKMYINNLLNCESSLVN